MCHSFKIISAAITVVIIITTILTMQYFGKQRVISGPDPEFDQCVKRWENYVRSKYIKTDFSEKLILDPSFSGSWIAYEGSTAEALFAHPMMLEPNPKLKLTHELYELEPIFDRLHEIRIKSEKTSSLRDAAMNLGYFKPIFNAHHEKK